MKKAWHFLFRLNIVEGLQLVPFVFTYSILYYMIEHVV